MSSPTIPNVAGGQMGRIRPTTRLAVRPAMGFELLHQAQEIRKLRLPGEGEPEWLGHKWLICLADAPGQVLKDWFSPQGGHDKESATERAMVYVNGRGAELVEIDEYPGEFDQLEWEHAWAQTVGV